MFSKENITLIVAIVALLLGGAGLVGGNQSSSSVLSGVGTRFPNGLFSGAGLSAGTTTPSTQGDLVVDSTATSTVMINSSTSGKGGCIQMETVTGTTVAITVSGTTISAAAGVCR